MSLGYGGWDDSPLHSLPTTTLHLGPPPLQKLLRRTPPHHANRTLRPKRTNHRRRHAMTMKWKVQDPRHLTVSEHADRMSAYALATRFAIGLTLSCEPIDHVKLWEPDGRAFYISATAAYPATSRRPTSNR